ncbi:MAG: hypothetical protein KAU21_03745, partial [Gammaproteobacteria bacterium]|nr:hypothetical protein [Gammaproteobacteria bacterium]
QADFNNTIKGHLIHKWKGIIPQILFITGLILLAPPSFASVETVLIIKSSDNSFFNETIDQLQKQTDAQVNYQIKTLDSLSQDDSLLTQSRAIITLGITAANYPFKESKSIPVIHSYITEFQYLNHPEQENHHTVLLDQPLKRYLEFIKYLLAANNVAIITNKKYEIAHKALESFTSTLDIKLERRLHKTGDNPLHLVRDLLQSNDVLLSLPNPGIYNRQSLKGILLASYRQNKPIISYSPAHVKSGALASIFSSPENIGNQLAKLLNKIINDSSFKPEAYYYASEFEVNINHRVAKSLGLTLADKNEIIRKLQKSKAR